MKSRELSDSKDIERDKDKDKDIDSNATEIFKAQKGSMTSLK